MKFGFDRPAASEEKIFEIVDGRRTDDERTTDGRTTEHGHPISPGELIKLSSFKSSEHINEKGDGPCRGFGYLSLFSDPTDLATWSQSELL